MCILQASSFLSHGKVLKVKVESFSLRGPAIIVTISGYTESVHWCFGEGGVVLNVESDPFSPVFTLGGDPFSKN